MSVSVLILTFNEETNLPECLRSVSWCDDIVVFDSNSTDRTVEIAVAAGARVYQRAFDNYGSQREAARTIVTYKHEWLLAIDADERVCDDLRKEIESICNNPEGPAAYRFRRKDHFMGQWIKHSTLYPSWFIRLYQHRLVRFEPRSVHEYPAFDGPLGELKGHLLHFSFNKGFNEWFLKHVRYAKLEAGENAKQLEGSGLNWAHLLSSDPVERRRALKNLSFRLPLRPLLRFLYMYIFRRGFLDGLPGFNYCCLLAIYEYLIVINLNELRFKARGDHF